MADLQFYKKIVALSKFEHKDQLIKPIEDFGFASQSNSVFLAAAEFAESAKEYPIILCLF